MEWLKLFHDVAEPGAEIVKAAGYGAITFQDGREYRSLIGGQRINFFILRDRRLIELIEEFGVDNIVAAGKRHFNNIDIITTVDIATIITLRESHILK